MAFLARCVSALLLSRTISMVAAVDSKFVRSGKMELSISSNGESQNVQDLLTEMEEMVERNDPASRDKIKQIMDLVEKLFPDMEFERNREKDQVGINLAAIGTCNTDSTKQQATIKNSTEKRVGENRRAHETCREEEQKEEAAKRKGCSELDAFLDLSTKPAKKPSGRDALVKWVVETSSLLCPRGPEAKDLDDKCREAETEHKGRKASCDKSQHKFESDFCVWRTELSIVCINAQTCYDAAVKAYNDHRRVAEDFIKTWKTEWASLKKIRCYIDVWMNDKDVKTVDASQYGKCKELQPDTSAMNIDFGEVPAKASCDTGAAQLHPGTNNFEQSEYSAFSKYVSEPIACPEHGSAKKTESAMLWARVDCSENGGNCNLAGAVGSTFWPECKSGVQHPESGTSRCWQQSHLGVAKQICEAHDDCIGLTRDNHGWEPRRGTGVGYDVAAHELMLKATDNGYAHLKCSGGATSCTVGGDKGSGDNFDEAKKRCDDQSDCFGLTRENNRWESRRSPGSGRQVAVHEAMLKGE